RRGIRDDVSRYEAVALALVEAGTADAGSVLAQFPPHDSPTRIEQFFQTLYLRYDERFVYGAPELKSLTRRLEWAPSSPAFDRSTFGAACSPVLDFASRLAGSSPSGPARPLPGRRPRPRIPSGRGGGRRAPRGGAPGRAGPRRAGRAGSRGGRSSGSAA